MATSTKSSINEQKPASNQIIAAVAHLLPKAVHEMARVMGMDKALRVAKALAGANRRIPMGTRINSGKAVTSLIDVLGCKELAEELMKHYGGVTLYIPYCAAADRALRNIEIHRTAEASIRTGRSMNSIVADISQQYSLSDRYIWKILKQPSPTTTTITTVQHD